MKTIVDALTVMFKQVWTRAAFPLLSAGTIWLFYWVFTRNASWQATWANNAGWYNWAQLILSVANAILIALALTMFAYLLHKRQDHGLTIMQALGSLGLSLLTTGCYVCGTVVLPTIGLAASLTALPFGGLEVKIITLLLTGYAIFQYAEKITGICHLHPRRPVRMEKRAIHLSRSLHDWQSVLVIGSLIAALLVLPLVPRRVSTLFGESVRAVDPSHQYSCGRVTE